MPNLKQLLHEREQLLERWRKINLKKLEKAANLVVQQYVNDTSDKGHYVRQFHNVLGYRAASDLAAGGLCSGCLYRTEAFIRLPQAERTGAKQFPAHLTKVHVEHTIPVATLVSAIERMGFAQWQPKFIYDFLLANSITTAMLEPEGKIPREGESSAGLVLRGFAHQSGVFANGHPYAGRPFMRYTAQQQRPRIFNVLRSEEIDVDSFTIDDFYRDLQQLLDEVGIDFRADACRYSRYSENL